MAGLHGDGQNEPMRRCLYLYIACPAFRAVVYTVHICKVATEIHAIENFARSILGLLYIKK